MAERDEGFLSRWSRLKRRESEEPLAPQADPVAPPATVDSPGSESEAAGADVAEDPDAGLTPIEELGRDSDYAAFMRAGVTPELRKQALHKLWRSNPVLANLDGMLEYGEDYSLPFKRGGVVSTIYRVGKGMAQAVEDEPPGDAGETATAASATDSDVLPDAPARPDPAERPPIEPPADPAANAAVDSADAKDDQGKD